MATAYAGTSARTDRRARRAQGDPRAARDDENFVKIFIDEARICSSLCTRTSSAHTSSARRQARFPRDRLRARTSARALRGHGARPRNRDPYEIAAYIGARLARASPCARSREPRHRASRRQPGERDHDVRRAREAHRLRARAAAIIVFDHARRRERQAAYLAPEQAQGKTSIGARTSSRSASRCWELTTGQRLFLAESDVDAVNASPTKDAPDPTTIVDSYPPELAKAVLRALARNAIGDGRARARRARRASWRQGRRKRRCARLDVARVPPDRKREPWEEASEIRCVNARAARRVSRVETTTQEDDVVQLEGGTREMAASTDGAGRLPRNARLRTTW